MPTGEPFTFHWYEGVPPFTGVAVNVLAISTQAVALELLIVTDGVEGVVIDTVTGPAVAEQAKRSVTVTEYEPDEVAATELLVVELLQT